MQFSQAIWATPLCNDSLNRPYSRSKRSNKWNNLLKRWLEFKVLNFNSYKVTPYCSLLSPSSALETTCQSLHPAQQNGVQVQSRLRIERTFYTKLLLKWFPLQWIEVLKWQLRAPNDMRTLIWNLFLKKLYHVSQSFFLLRDVLRMHSSELT